MDDIAIRELLTDDWGILRDMRMRALTLHPGLYLGRIEGVARQPPEYWQDLLSEEGRRIFGLFDGDMLIGITGVFTWREDPDGQTGFMGMSFIEPAYRGRGLSCHLYEARIRFAKAHRPWNTLIVSHRAGNEASRRSMLKYGFTLLGTEEIEWPDGTRALDYNYQLDLEAVRRAS